MVGRANENTQGGVMFKEGVKDVKYAISAEEGYSITIASEDGKAVKTIPVRFNGMPTNTMARVETSVLQSVLPLVSVSAMFMLCQQPSMRVLAILRV